MRSRYCGRVKTFPIIATLSPFELLLFPKPAERSVCSCSLMSSGPSDLVRGQHSKLPGFEAGAAGGGKLGP
jgi:hypothetical protein